jgi:hypothetical protein
MAMGYRVNFRDEKTILHVGQAQVRSQNSTQNAPALGVAAYAMLLLAATQTYGLSGVPDRKHQPKWYKRGPQQRATTNELINQLRIELWASALKPEHFSDFMTGTPPNQKFEKSEFNLQPQCLHAFANQNWAKLQASRSDD